MIIARKDAPPSMFPPLLDHPVVVIDFETTGMSPERGARVTEVGAVLLEAGRITRRFQSLMNAGMRVPPAVETYTGITNAMIRAAPPAGEVMASLAEFIGNTPLVAHNASFDRKFLDAELALVQRQCSAEMACSLLISRRVFPGAPSYSLGNLLAHLGLSTDRTFHRALADATATAELWLRIVSEQRQRYGLAAGSFDALHEVQAVPPRKVARYFRALAEGRIG